MRTRMLLIALAAGIAGAGLLAALLFAVGAIPGDTTTTTVVDQAATQPASLTTTAPSARALYSSTAPGVVEIQSSVITQVETPFGPQSQSGTASGAGSVIDQQGHILTAQHVIAGATSVKVTFQDGTVCTAKVLGSDSATDIAVIKIDPAGLTLHPIALGTLTSLRVGDRVYAIGDPFGYERSLSSGLVSGLDRTIEAPNGFNVAHSIQTDAALNPGNSGGPLLDVQGRLIGVVDQIATGGSQVTSNTGVGFAVPVDVVRSILPQLISGETPRHAYLGVSATDGATPGALVQTVAPGGPAADAGIEPGDIIVAIDSTTIGGVSDLVAATAAHAPGDQVTVTVRRGSKQLSARATLGTQPIQATTG